MTEKTTLNRLRLVDLRPQSRLVVKQTPIIKPPFPVIDAHNHLGEVFGGGWDKRTVAELIDVRDQANVRKLIDLDGGWGESLLHAHLDHFKATEQDRFSIFGGVDGSAWPEQGVKLGEWAAQRLRLQKER